MSKIDNFRNDYFFLSNFYEVPVKYHGITYQNSEAAFQAQKCMDPDDKFKFANLNSSEAKRLGRHVKLRPDWEQIKVTVMSEVVYNKFSQNKELGDRLIETGDAYLEEGNDWGDKVWGRVNGEGENFLGQILMDTREVLRKDRKNGQKKA